MGITGYKVVRLRNQFMDRDIIEIQNQFIFRTRIFVKGRLCNTAFIANIIYSYINETQKQDFYVSNGDDR